MSIPVDFIVKARDGASTVFNRVGDRLDRLKGKFSAFGAVNKALFGIGVAGAAAVGGVAAVTAGLIHQALEIDDNIGKLQDLKEKYKVSTDFLQLMAQVGGEAGVEVATVAKGIGKLSETIAKARNGGGKELDLLASVGVKGKDINKSAEEIFADISTVFAKKNKSSADVQKILAAKALFGKAGIELMPILQMGGKKLHETMMQMKKDGVVLSDAQVQAADDTGDAFGRAKTRLEAVKNRAFLELNPAIDAITKSINDMLNSGGSGKLQSAFKQIGDQIAKIAPKIIEKIPAFFDKLANIDFAAIVASIKAIASALGTVFGAINKVGTLVGWDKLIFGAIALYATPALIAIAPLVPVIFSFAVAIGAAVLAASPLLLVILALSAAALLIYKNWTPIAGFFTRIGKMFFDHLTTPINIAITAINLLISGFNKISGLKVPQIDLLPVGASPAAQGARIPTGASPPLQTNMNQALKVELTAPKGYGMVATPQAGIGVLKTSINTGKM